MARALGLDFGTTNTVIATVEPQSGATRSLRFSSTAGATDTARTALAFMKQPAAAGPAAVGAEAGQAAIRLFIDHPGECRFLQSIKTFAASAAFQATIIHGRRHSYEDLMETFLRRLRDYAGDEWPGEVSRLVVGRPVRFAGGNPDDGLAVKRYRAALDRIGFAEVHFVLEPVAAAYWFAQRLTRDATVLVADFGGGTTDYSLIRFEREAGQLRAIPIGHSGVGVAGDQFDYRLIDNLVAPEIGKGSHFRSFDKLLDLPAGYFNNFSRWNQLSVFKTTRQFTYLQELVRLATEPEKLQLFVNLVDYDEGYPLYQAISATKMALSLAQEAEFVFPPLGDAGRKSVRRSDFEAWIVDDLARIENALDEVLAKTNTPAAAIDQVFLTGGTSLVPAVRRMFERRFDVSRIESGGELLSIAHGLALISVSDDVSRWAV
ncbi:MAG: Hsp70 family protein [Phyllobacteriaceae bacterium]|nr:Hsp70 family protein [Phyllobacteriaceae bacterium]